ncbi:PAS domain S-box protein [Rhizorhabdus argentea]|uniref:PAS domain S-box protein n=1 Tax=Rhizorhabdus argentea TaxID=1387174 RepID=UPI0030EEE440
MPSLDRFFTLSPDLLTVASWTDGRLMRVNPATCQILGWSEAELLSRPFLELIHPDDRDRVAAVAAAALAAGQTSIREEHRILRKDGSYLWTEWHDACFADEDLIYATGRDITERKQVEAALAAAQAERTAVLESIGDAFYSVDAEWRVTYANARATALLNRSEPMVGRRLGDFVSNRSEVRFRRQLALFRQAMADRQQRDVEYFNELAGRWVSARIYPRDDGGLSVYYQDITERNHMEETLRASQAHFEAVARLVPDLLWRAEPDGTATWSSQGWCEYFGQPMETLPDNGWGKLHPDDAEKVRTTFEASFRSARSVSHECRVLRYDGVYRWFLVRIQPLFDSDGAVTAWFGASTDIDDLKCAQGQQELLIAELQHRTRNLLGVVRSLATQTLAGSATLDNFSERFNSRLGALSRVQSFLSRGVAIEIRDLVRAELAAHGIEPSDPRVIVDGPSAELPASAVQPLALAVHELTTNALKHGAFAMPAGRLAVRWSIDTKTEPPSLALEWRESGVAMPDHEKPTRRGFGLNLIECGLPYQLGTTTSVALSPGGLVCNLVLPLLNAGPAQHDA